jgi:HK97 family phage portal protein
LNLRQKLANMLDPGRIVQPVVGVKAAGKNSEPVTQIVSSQNGRPQWSTWSTERAITNGLKASTWVYACCRKIVAGLSSVPWYVEELRGDDWERVPNHPIEQLLQRPNRYMSGQDIFERITYHLNLGGNGICHIVTAQGMPVELWPLMPDRIAPVPDAVNWLRGYEYRVSGQKPRLIEPQYILHFMFCDPSNPYWGLSPFMAAQKTVDTDLEAVNWNKVAMQNRAVPDGLYSVPELLTKEQWEELREQLREQKQGADNARDSMIVGGGAKWQTMSFNPVEMDFLNSRKFSREEICAVYHVPPILVGNMDHASYNNYATAKQMLWEDAIIPQLDDLQAALNLGLVPFWQPDMFRPGVMPKLRVRYDLSHVQAILQNFTELCKQAEILTRCGVPFNIINQRLGMGFDPIDGLDVIPSRAPSPTGQLSAGNPSERKSVHTKEQRTIIWKAFDSQLTAWETRIAREIRGLFADEAEAVIAAYLDKGADAVPAALRSTREDWRETLKTAHTAVVEHFGKQTYGQVATEAGKSSCCAAHRQVKAFDPFRQAVRLWTEQRAAKDVQRVQETTKGLITEAILEGQAEKETVDQIAGRIRALYDTFIGNDEIDVPRSMVIARTETAMAANYGHHEGAVQGAADYNLPMLKEWISSADGRVRDSHAMLDGETKKLDELFSNGLMYPAEGDGPPEEIIQCRCVVGYEVDIDALQAQGAE